LASILDKPRLAGKIPVVSKSWIRWITLLAAACPALIPLCLIRKFGVDFPYWDEWDPEIAGLYIKAHQHRLTFGDLMKQHNEHRIFFPRLIFLALSAMTHWSAMAEMIVQWLIVCATSLLILALCRRTESDEGFRPIFRPEPMRWRTIFLWFVMNLLIFSPAAWENWLWGIGIVNVMPMFLIAVALVIVTSDLRPWPKTIAAIAIFIVSLYSSGNGVLCWPLATPLLLWPLNRKLLSRQRWMAIAWCAAFVVFTGMYFIHYAKPEHRGAHPYANAFWPVLGYIPIFLGVQFAWVSTYPAIVISSIVGGAELLLLAGAVTCFFWFWLKRGEYAFGGRLLVWIAVGGFAFLSAIMASLARAGTGVDQALESPRYVTYAVYLLVGLLQLAPIICDRLRTLVADRPHRLLLSQLPAALVAIVIVLQLFAYPNAFRNARLIQMARREGKAALMLIEVLPDNPRLATLVFPDLEPTLSQAKIFNQMGYIRPPLIESKDAQKIQETDGARVAGAAGKIEQAGQTGPGQAAATGWAIFANKRSPADAVFLTYDDEHRQPIIFAFADIGLERADIAQQHGSDAYAGAGWIARFPASSLPSYMRVTTISAWALDTDTGRAFKLDGSFTVQP
jgi:hypothetical protein